MAAATPSQPEAQLQPQVPEITVLTRVASIPIIASSLDQLHSTLSSNMLTRSPYHAAQVISQTAYNFSQPLQIRLAPLILSADGFANKGLDAIESKYPYPFKVKPEDVVSYVRDRRDSVVSSANEQFDKNVKSPAVGVAEGIDKKFAPIFDYLESAVNSSPSSECQYQYQRVYTISKHLRDNVYVYSSEHLKQLQQQNVIVQKAIDTANSIQGLASASITTAQTRIHALSDSMLLELQKLQQSTATLPQTLQFMYPDISKTITDLRNIVTTPDITVGEKAHRVVDEVSSGVRPMLEKLAQRIGDLAKAIGSKREEVTHDNGHAAPVQ